MANKTTSASIRLTEKQKKHLNELASKADKSLTDFILISCEKCKITVLTEGHEIAEALHKLRMSIDKNHLYGEKAQRDIEAVVFKLDSILEKITPDDELDELYDADDVVSKSDTDEDEDEDFEEDYEL